MARLCSSGPSSLFTIGLIALGSLILIAILAAIIVKGPAGFQPAFILVIPLAAGLIAIPFFFELSCDGQIITMKSPLRTFEFSVLDVNEVHIGWDRQINDRQTNRNFGEFALAVDKSGNEVDIDSSGNITIRHNIPSARIIMSSGHRFTFPTGMYPQDILQEVFKALQERGCYISIADNPPSQRFAEYLGLTIPKRQY